MCFSKEHKITIRGGYSTIQRWIIVCYSKELKIQRGIPLCVFKRQFKNQARNIGNAFGCLIGDRGTDRPRQANRSQQPEHHSKQTEELSPQKKRKHSTQDLWVYALSV